jgi:hypothetical protein
MIKILKKVGEIKWYDLMKKYFSTIKKSLEKTLVLTSPDYKKDFKILPFSSKHTITTVLFHKNDEGHEQPLNF